MAVRVEFFVTLVVVVIAFASAQECGQLTNGNIEDKNAILPWTVEVRERMTDDVICRGTLISKQHVLIGKLHSRGHIDSDL